MLTSVSSGLLAQLHQMFPPRVEVQTPCGDGWNRTSDHLLMRQLLYQVSYVYAHAVSGGKRIEHRPTDSVNGFPIFT